jgi:hypothetical protein
MITLVPFAKHKYKYDSEISMKGSTNGCERFKAKQEQY